MKENKEEYKPKKIGRPKKITKTILNALNFAYSKGLSDAEACLFAGITKPTLYDYIDENPEYEHERAVIKENVKMHAKMNIAEKIINEKDLGISKYYLERHDSDYSSNEAGKSNGEIEKLIEGLKEI